jgi:hypothetical protein
MNKYDIVRPTDKWRSGKPPTVAMVLHCYTDDDIELLTPDNQNPIVFADEIEVIHTCLLEAEELIRKEKDRELQPVKEALQVITTALKNDPEYFYTWQANIAMAFQDEFDIQSDKYKPNIFVANRTSIHEIANKAAINFLNLLCK